MLEEDKKNINDLEKALLVYCDDDECTTNTDISINATSISKLTFCHYIYFFFGIVIIILLVFVGNYFS